MVLLVGRGVPRAAARSPGPRRRHRSVLAALGRCAQEDYLEQRYSSAAPDYPRDEQPAVELGQGLGAAYDWARGLSGPGSASSGTTGALFQYGLWGLDSSNEVALHRQSAATAEPSTRSHECPSSLAASTRATTTTSSPRPTYDQDDPESATPPIERRLAPRPPAERVSPASPGGDLVDVWPLDRRPATRPSAARLPRRPAEPRSRLHICGVAYPLDNAIYQWEEGDRRLRELSAERRLGRPLQRAVEAVRDELRRRIGPTFSAYELADLYGAGHRLGLEAARWAMPMEAADLDPQAIIDGGFYSYLRGANDYSRRKGRRGLAVSRRSSVARPVGRARARSARARSSP